MVTGSHNPKDYNGFKMMIAGVTLAGDEIQDLLRRIEAKDWIDGNGGLENRNYVPAYTKIMPSAFNSSKSHQS